MSMHLVKNDVSSVLINAINASNVSLYQRVNSADGGSLRITLLVHAKWAMCKRLVNPL